MAVKQGNTKKEKKIKIRIKIKKALQIPRDNEKLSFEDQKIKQSKQKGQKQQWPMVYYIENERLIRDLFSV